MTFPLVSAIIPTYNRRNLVQEAIDSALAQTYPALEVIVVDDGSTDGTEDILATQYGSRVHYFWQENRGESAARNKGIGIARGEYIALLDSDDRWLPDKIGRQVEAIERSPSLWIIGCQARMIDSAGALMNDGALVGGGITPEDGSLRKLLLRNGFGGGSIALLRREAIDQVGGFDPTIRFGEDWDLWLRLRICGGDFGIVDTPLTLIRRHQNTQCHLPRLENIECVLQDHLSLLNKAFDALAPLSDELNLIRKRSFGRQYGEAAIASYTWQKTLQGHAWLSEAIRLDPGVWRDPEQLSNLLVDYGLAVTELESDISSRRINDFVHATVSDIGTLVSLDRSFAAKLRGRLYAEVGFRHYLAADHEQARQFMTLAFKADRSLWRDRGLVRRWLRSWSS